MAKQSILFSFDSATNRFKPLALIGSQTEAYTESNPIPESVFDNFAYTANYTCYIKNGRTKGLPENEAYVTYTVNKSDATGSGSQEALVVGPDTMKTPRRFMRKSGFIDGAKKWGPWEELMTSTNIGSSSVLNKGVFVDGNVLSEPRGTMNFQASTSNLSALNLEGRGATWVHLSHFAHANNGYAFQMAAKIYNGDPTTTNDEKNWGMKLRATVPTGTSWGPWHNVVSYPEDDNTGIFGYRTVGDWNLLNSGTIMIGAGKGAGQKNSPISGTDDNGLVLPMFYTNKRKGVQLWYATENEPMGYVRILNNSRWGSWRKIFDIDRMFFTQDGVAIKSNVITNNVQVREPSGETEPLYLNKYLNNPVAFKYNGKYITLQSLEDRFSRVLMSERVNDSNKDILNAVTNISGERIYSGDFNHHAGLPSSNRYGRIIHFGWSSGYTAQLHIGTLHHGDQVFAGTALAYIRNGKPRTTTNEWGPWHEIGAYPMIAGNNSIDEYVVRAADWNLDRIRKYFGIEHGKSNVKNSPDPSETSGAVMSIFRQINYGTQLHFSTNYNRLYLRSIHGGTWKPWVKIVDGDRLNFLNNGVIIRDDLQVEKIDGYKNSAFVDLLLNTKGDKHVKFKAGGSLISLQDFYAKSNIIGTAPSRVSGDMNNFKEHNRYYNIGPEVNKNNPGSYGVMKTISHDAGLLQQIFFQMPQEKIHIRNYWNNVNRSDPSKWSPWTTIEYTKLMHNDRWETKSIADANHASGPHIVYNLPNTGANRPFGRDSYFRIKNVGIEPGYSGQFAIASTNYTVAYRYKRDDGGSGVDPTTKYSPWQQIAIGNTPLRGRLVVDAVGWDNPTISLGIGEHNSGFNRSSGAFNAVFRGQNIAQISNDGLAFFENRHKLTVNNIESRGNENLNLNANKEGGVLFRTSEGGAITLQRFHESTHLVGDISHNLSGGRDANKMYAHNGWYMLRPSSDSNGVQNGPDLWGTMHTGGYGNGAIHQMVYCITRPVIAYRYYLSNESGKDVTNDTSKWSEWHHLDFRKVVQEDKWSYHNVTSPDEATSINKVYQLNGNARNKPLGDDGFFRIFNIGNDKNYYGQFAMSYSRGIIVFRNRRENGGSSVDSATKFEKQWKQIVVTDTPVVGKISVDATSTSSGTPSFSLCIGDSDTGFNKADGGHAIDIYTDGVYTGKLRHGTLTMIGANSKVSAKNITGEAGNTDDHHLNLNTTNSGNVNFKTSGGQIVSLQKMYTDLQAAASNSGGGASQLNYSSRTPQEIANKAFGSNAESDFDIVVIKEPGTNFKPSTNMSEIIRQLDRKAETMVHGKVSPIRSTFRNDDGHLLKIENRRYTEGNRVIAIFLTITMYPRGTKVILSQYEPSGITNERVNWNTIDVIKQGNRLVEKDNDLLLNNDKADTVSFTHTDGTKHTLQELFQSAADGKGLVISGIEENLSVPGLTKQSSWAEIVGAMSEKIKEIKIRDNYGHADRAEKYLRNLRLSHANNIMKNYIFSPKGIEYNLNKSQSIATSMVDEMALNFDTYYESVKNLTGVNGGGERDLASTSFNINDLEETMRLYLISPYAERARNEIMRKLKDSSRMAWIIPNCIDLMSKTPRPSLIEHFTFTSVVKTSRNELFSPRTLKGIHTGLRTVRRNLVYGMFIIIRGTYDSLYIRNAITTGNPGLNSPISKDLPLEGHLINTKHGVGVGINGSLIYKPDKTRINYSNNYPDITIIYLQEKPGIFLTRIVVNQEHLEVGMRYPTEGVDFFKERFNRSSGIADCHPLISIKGLGKESGQDHAYMMSFGYVTDYNHLNIETVELTHSMEDFSGGVTL